MEIWTVGASALDCDPQSQTGGLPQITKKSAANAAGASITQVEEDFENELKLVIFQKKKNLSIILN